MADVFTQKKRSEIMSRISSKHTSPEISVRKALYKLGFRHSLHDKKLPGKPDIVIKQAKTAIFVNFTKTESLNTALNTYGYI